MRPKLAVTTRISFYIGYGLLAFLAFASVTSIPVLLKHRSPARRHTHTRVTQGCVSPACAVVGDTLSVVLDGKVIQIDESQPGVRCVQIVSKTHGGTYCVVK